MIFSWLGTLAASLATAVVGLGSSVLSARLLGPEGRGVLAAAMLVISTAAVFAQIGLGQSLVFQVRSRASDQTFLLVLSVLLIPAIAVVLALAASFSGLSRIDWHDPLHLIPIGAAAFGLMTFAQQAAQLQTSLILYNCVRVLQPLAVVLAMIGIGFLSVLTVNQVVAAQVASAACAAAIGLLYIARSTRPQTGAPRQILLDARNYFMRGISYHGLVMTGFVSQNIDKIYLLTSSDARSLGLYVTAFAASRIAGYFYEGLATVLYSRFAGDKREVIHAALTFSFRMTFLPMLMGCALVGLLSGPIMRLLFGAEFVGAAPIFAILTVESVIGSASWVLAQQFNAMGRPSLVLARQIAALLPVLAGLYLIPASDPGLGLALLLLAGSVLRLLISLLMFRMIDLPVPQLAPRRADIGEIRRILRGLRSRC